MSANRDEKILGKKAIFAAGLLLAATSALLRFWAFSQTPFANGWDSYFYLIQVKAWIETGKMHSPEASLIYPLMRSIYWFTGDYVLMYKAASAFLAGAFTAVAIWVTHAWSSENLRNYPINGWISSSNFRFVLMLLVGAYTVWSPHLTYFAAQYPKNLLGMVFLMGFIGAFPEKRLLAVLLLLLNYMAHRLTFGLAALYAILYAAAELFGNRRHLWLLGKILLAVVAGTVVLMFFLPGTFHWLDFERIAESMAGKNVFHFPPLSFWKTFDEDGRLSIWWKIETALAVLCWLGLLLSILARRRQKIETKEYAVVLLPFVLLFPWLEWSLTGISFRFFLVFVLFGPLFLYFLVGQITNLLTNSKREGLGHVIIGILSCAIIGLFLSSFFSKNSYDPHRHDPNYDLYAALTQSAQAQLNGAVPELMIAHNALAEYYTFTTGIDALPWQPEYDIAPEKLWRMAGNVKMPELQYFAGDSLARFILPLPGSYALMREDIWQKIKEEARRDTLDETGFVPRMESWYNPYKIRPAFLLRRKE